MSKLSKPASVTAGLVLIGLFFAAWMVVKSLINQSASSGVFAVEKILRFNIEVTNASTQAIDDFQFDILLPLDMAVNQRLKQTSSSIDVTARDDPTPNTLNTAQFEIKKIPPLGKKIVTLTTVVTLAEHPNAVSLSDEQRYLDASDLIQIQHPELQSLALELRSNTPKQSIENIYNWVSTEISFKGFLKRDYGALYALTNRSGDSTEFMYLTVALARSLGIPAKAMGGFIANKNRIVRSADFHNWAEVHIDGVWQVVDPQNKTLFDQSENYVAFKQFSPSKADGRASVNSHTMLTALSSEPIRIGF